MEHFGQNNHPRDYVDFARITKIGFCIKLHCIEEYGEDFQASSVTIPFFKDLLRRWICSDVESLVDERNAKVSLKAVESFSLSWIHLAPAIAFEVKLNLQSLRF